MSDADNPYRAPEAPASDDFIAVAPIRRPMSNFVAAVSCFAFAAFLLALEGLFVLAVIDRWSKAGTKAENHPTFFDWRDLVLVPIGCSVLASLLSGRSFWARRDRQGLILFMVALGAFASTFLVPLLFP
jgi:hypothetical protein